MIMQRWSLVALALATSAQVMRAQDLDARTLFVANCAACHGETGAGDGWTKLDRPARSFRDGGFSYGNTPEALFRTITYGIPGTPMPSFESSLTPAQREILAQHVVSLGPPVEVVDPESTVMTVGERPRFVRGYLPPIAEGMDERPRGLLLGRPEGFTFEYRLDDVRLLGIRQGAFAERRDWTGRGGTALAPLGGVVHLVERGDPRATFRLRGVGELTARLKGTWVQGDEAGVGYLLEHEGTPVAEVSEAPRPAGTSVGAGFSRTFHIKGLREGRLVQRLHAFGDARRADSFSTGGRDGDFWEWSVRRRGDGLFEVVGVSDPRDVGSVRGYSQQGGVFEMNLPLRVGSAERVTITTMTTHEWSDEVRARFIEDVSR